MASRFKKLTLSLVIALAISLSATPGFCTMSHCPGKILVHTCCEDKASPTVKNTMDCCHSDKVIKAIALLPETKIHFDVIKIALESTPSLYSFDQHPILIDLSPPQSLRLKTSPVLRI
jgi:hypothetical protein